MKLTWPDFKFPPINLLNAPIQAEYDKTLDQLMLTIIERQRVDGEILRLLENASELESYDGKLINRQKTAEQRLNDLNFLYYTRTGRFYD